ncbi:membrane dipeptidase [Ramlibacter sp. PS3R-8]|uniref:dipeptidase n=1 Tax=Ramlibacter sp. PS3R-8 TaxID=3133437 RepID=UPI00309E0AD4
MRDFPMRRRQFGMLAAAALGGTAVAQGTPAAGRHLLADMHSHYGMFLPRLFGLDLARHMKDNGIALLAWSVVDDRPWISTGSGPLRQVSEPKPGAIWEYWNGLVNGYEARLAEWKLAKALGVADLDAARMGEARVLLACESANFLEGDVQRLAAAHARGVRHLQLVHYIRSPLGDHQTAAPSHGGLTPLGAQVVAECRRLGIVVDLAHGTPALVDAALDASDAAPVWSHSWVSPAGGTFADPGYIARSLSPAHARKIAARGGVVGLWCLRSSAGYPVNSKSTYADEILRMCELLEPEHVAFGTDMEGVWPNRMMNDYDDLRDVANDLVRRGLPAATLEQVFFGNYVRVVRQCMANART